MENDAEGKKILYLLLKIKTEWRSVFEGWTYVYKYGLTLNWFLTIKIETASIEKAEMWYFHLQVIYFYLVIQEIKH